MNRLTALLTAMSLALTMMAQQPVPVGAGSYASFPPTVCNRTTERGGDQSTQMQTRTLWIDESPERPIPTNDWWTGLITARYADALWSYPAMVHPSADGVRVNYPTHWNENGTEVKSDAWIEVQARYTDRARGESDRFAADAAIASGWHDWDVEMRMPSASGDASMVTTLVHGQPFTWIALQGALTPRLVLSNVPDAVENRGDRLALTIGSDVFGIYLPAGAEASVEGNTVSVNTPADKAFAVVALLPSAEALDNYAEYAYNAVRATRVEWQYDARRGEITSVWSVQTEHLLTGATDGPVLQGFLPHQYKSASQAPAFGGDTYLTPRGTLRMAAGREFAFTHDFSGQLPWWPVPANEDAPTNPYRPEVMASLINTYAQKGTMGDDTYWGGKGLMQMALDMTFALETGNEEAYRLAHDKLREKMEDWLTYTPGENRVFFAAYPRWGGLVGEATSYDSDTFNDHHFHYGYYTLAGAILCLVDDDFCRRYGPMLREVAKDYANWERDDSRYPFLRTLDPWVGHSYAGGLGDQANSNGNGQESSSEAMQGWGGIYLLGVALGDDAMRDAGIFGWSTEARATREYWFDVDARFDRFGYGGNYDHTLFTSPYNTNITCKGIGWWTWFSGSPLHMHGIQWLPVSPALDYLSWDRDFVAWAYHDMMHTPGWNIEWFANGTDPSGGTLDMLANDDWGNVALAYMQRALPDEAAAIFDTALERGLGIATAVSTGHISYYLIHSHRTYGDIDFTVHADLPTAQMMVRPDGRATYVVYNPGDERDVTFYRDDAALRTVRVPARKMVAISAEAAPADVVIDAPDGLRTLTSLPLSARVLDQYGATFAQAELTASKGTLSGGRLDVSGLTEGERVVVTASYGPLSASAEVIVSAPAVPNAITISPQADIVERGADIKFAATVTDNYGETMTDADIRWSVDGEAVDYPVVGGNAVGRHTVTATAGEATATHALTVAPTLPDLALGRPAAASSVENAGTLVAGAFDGDPSTRWGSQQTDGQWVLTDLGRQARITSVVLEWETAYASDYVIETAPEGAVMIEHNGPSSGNLRSIPADGEWTVQAEVSGRTAGGAHKVTVNAEARYVRMRAVKRATVYGVSLYAMEVHGLPADPNAPLGLDVSAPANVIDDTTSLQFTARSMDAQGNLTDVPDAVWSASQGSITAAGLFIPATYGEAVITAVSGEHSASAAVYVNETSHLRTLRTDPAEITVATGSVARFALDARDQFDGVYRLEPQNVRYSVLPRPDAVEVNVAEGYVRPLVAGHWTVEIASGNASTVLTVNAIDRQDINVALNADVQVASGDNPRFITDGNLATRWQAVPGTDQSVIIELPRLYAVNKVATVWEAALASQYRVDLSVDGTTWVAVAEGADPQAGVHQMLEGFCAPARFVRIVPLTLSAAARTYGVSLFEVEVYAESEIDASADHTAPAITMFETETTPGNISVNAAATDDSGYLVLSLVATAAARTFSTAAAATSGTPVSLSLSDLPAGTYALCLIAMDAVGNEAQAEAAITVDAVPLTGVNLALGKPATASSQENAALGPQNAVDGLENTRWGSRFADDEWLQVDLGEIYRLERFEIVVLDAAFAREAVLEGSLDGEEWFEIQMLSRSETGEETIVLPSAVNARYVRYRCLERATGYGVSVNELRVFGDYSDIVGSGIGVLGEDADDMPVYTPDGRPAGRSLRHVGPGLYVTPKGAVIKR